MFVQCILCNTHFNAMERGLLCPNCPPALIRRVAELSHYYGCNNHGNDIDYRNAYSLDFINTEPLPITMQIGVNANRLKNLKKAYELGLYSDSESIMSIQEVMEQRNGD